MRTKPYVEKDGFNLIQFSVNKQSHTILFTFLEWECRCD